MYVFWQYSAHSDVRRFGCWLGAALRWGSPLGLLLGLFIGLIVETSLLGLPKECSHYLSWQVTGGLLKIIFCGG